jgi:hypothetical protein
MRSVERWQPHRELSGPAELWGVAVQNSDPVKWIIKATTRLDASDCQLICATHNAALATGGEKALWCESLVNRAGQPIVQISFGSELIQMQIREARHHVGILNECIEGAISDALITKFMREVILASDEPAEANRRIGTLLQMFRDFREELTKPTDTSELET